MHDTTLMVNHDHKLKRNENSPAEKHHAALVVADRNDRRDVLDLLMALGLTPDPWSQTWPVTVVAATQPAKPAKTAKPFKYQPTTIGPGCGKPRGYQRHYARGERPCEECKNVEYAARRAAYARKKPGARVFRTVAACGTDSGYTRHLRLRERPCQACRAAHAAYSTAYKRQRREARLAAVPDLTGHKEEK